MRVAIIKRLGNRDSLSKVWCSTCDARLGPICYAIAWREAFRRADDPTFPMIAKVLRLWLSGVSPVPRTDEYATLHEREEQYTSWLSNVYGEDGTTATASYEEAISRMPPIPDSLWIALSGEGFTVTPTGYYRQVRGHHYNGNPAKGRSNLPEDLQKKGEEPNEMLGKIIGLPSVIHCPHCDTPFIVRKPQDVA